MSKSNYFRLFVILTNINFSGVAQAEAPVDFHAYFRSGAAISQGLTEGVCFQLPGAPTEFSRFGNECGLYSEIFMSKTYQANGGLQYRGHFTLAFASDGNSTWEDTTSPSHDLIVSHREAYVEAIGVFDEQNSIWVGKRFYNRYFLEMWDFFLLDQNGTGFGVEKLHLGLGKADIAMFRHFSQEPDSPIHLTGDLRLYSIPAGGGSIGIAMIYGQTSKRGRQTGQEKWVALNGQQYTLDFKLKSNSWDYRTYLQYGQGLYGGRPELSYGRQTGSTIQSFQFSTYDRSVAGQQAAQAWQKSTTMRWIHDLQYVPPGSRLHWNLAVAWTQVDFGGRQDDSGKNIPIRDTVAAGLHPTWFINRFWGVDADLYYSRIENGLPRQNYDGTSEQAAITRELNKATLGLVLRPSAIYQIKPQIRLYASFAKWNEDQRSDRLITNNSEVYIDQTEGYTLGVQGEVWW